MFMFTIEIWHICISGFHQLKHVLLSKIMTTFAVNGLHNLPIITKMHSALESNNIVLPSL